MTIEELLDMPVADIALMSDEALEAHLRPYFPLTRPGNITGLLETDSSGACDEIKQQLEALRAKTKKVGLKALLS